MNQQTKNRLAVELATVQKRARTRTMDVEHMLKEARDIEVFLRRKTTPIGTAVRSNWDRVANSYRGIPEGTITVGRKTEDGIVIEVKRSANAFGNRSWTVTLPAGYKLTGKGTHTAGAAEYLCTAIIEKEDHPMDTDRHRRQITPAQDLAEAKARLRVAQERLTAADDYVRATGEGQTEAEQAFREKARAEAAFRKLSAL